MSINWKKKKNQPTLFFIIILIYNYYFLFFLSFMKFIAEVLWWKSPYWRMHFICISVKKRVEVHHRSSRVIRNFPLKAIKEGQKKNNNKANATSVFCIRIGFGGLLSRVHFSRALFPWNMLLVLTCVQPRMLTVCFDATSHSMPVPPTVSRQLVSDCTKHPGFSPDFLCGGWPSGHISQNKPG